MRTYMVALFTLCAFFAMPNAALFGQSTAGNGSVTGRVTDTSGGVIGAASATLTDTTTNIGQTIQTNAVGLYVFNNVKPGIYDLAISAPGFRKALLSKREVTVGSTLTFDVSLEVGATTETLEVMATAEAELQTLNSTMGSTISSQGLLELPSINRDVSGLLFVQPTVAPTFGGAEGNVTSGQVAGNMADQNTYMLDGGNSTSDLDGDNGTYVASRSGVIPTPLESVEEIRVNTNNMTADFGLSNGAQMMVTTKRGT